LRGTRCEAERSEVRYLMFCFDARMRGVDLVVLFFLFVFSVLFFFFVFFLVCLFYFFYFFFFHFSGGFHGY